jgi:hypothetical protein
MTGLFETQAQAAAAVEDLLLKGADSESISLVATETVGKEQFGIQTKSKVSEGVAVGAGTGGGLAALVAGLTSIGALSTTGIGLVAVGPIIAALAGGGAGAAIGGTLGGLIGLSISKHELKYYEDAIDKGAVLVGVDKNNVDSDVAKRVFERHNVMKIAAA